MAGSVVIRENPVILGEKFHLTLRGEKEFTGGNTPVFFGYQDDNRAFGGFWSCTFRIRADDVTLKEMFERGLGRGVHVYGEGLRLLHEGMIYEMVYNLPPNSYRISLENMWNKALMRTDYDGDGTVDRSTTIENTDSQALYGTKTVVLSGGETSSLSVADQAVQQYINIRGFPIPEPDIGGGSGEEYLEVFCRGYIETLKWPIYNQTSNTGNINMSQLISDVIGDRASVRLVRPSAWDDTMDWEEGDLTDADSSQALYADMDLKLPFDGDADDDGPDSLTPSTETGGIIYSGDHAAFGQAIQLAEATTNLISNPSAEVDTSVWSKGSNLDSFTRYTSDSYYGSACFRLVDGADASGSEYISTASTIAASPSTDYTASLFAKELGAAYTDYNILIDEYDSGFVWLRRNVINMDVDLAWGLQTGTITTGASTAYIRMYIQVDVTHAVDLLVDGIQLEQKAYPTPYCDGSLGTGHSWSGTAHASTSSRTATDLRYSITGSLDEGTIGFKLTRLAGSDTNRHILDWVYDSNNYIYCWMGVNNKIHFRITRSGSQTLVSSTNALDALTPTEVELVWDATTGLQIFIDGTLDNTPETYTGSNGGDPTTLYIGALYTSIVQQLNGWLDEFFVLDRALTADEVSFVYNRDVSYAQIMAHPEAARDGSYGVGFVISGTTAHYITDTSPSNETEYTREAWVDPSGLTMATDDEFVLMVFHDGSNDVARMVLGYDGTDYYAYPQARLDGGSYTDGARFSLDALYTNLLRMSLLQSSGSDDGRVYALKNNVLLSEITGVDNDTLDITEYRAGAVSGLDAGTSGILKMDTDRGSNDTVFTVTAESGVCEFISGKSLTGNATLVTQEYDADLRPYDVIQGNVSLGDSANNPWTFYIKEGRIAVFKRAAPAEVT